MTELADRKCEACHGGTPKLDDAQIAELSKQLGDWVVADGHLRKTIKTKNFLRSLELANKIGEIAEAEGHHPDLLVRWGELGIDLWTHAINGLSEADFILAAKIDRLTSSSIHY
jgi:4a-hydroxytetrahydrobiopterin dehydratase